jgi:hypothetical protein
MSRVFWASYPHACVVHWLKHVGPRQKAANQSFGNKLSAGTGEQHCFSCSSCHSTVVRSHLLCIQSAAVALFGLTPAKMAKNLSCWNEWKITAEKNRGDLPVLHFVGQAGSTKASLLRSFMSFTNCRLLPDSSVFTTGCWRSNKATTQWIQWSSPSYNCETTFAASPINAERSRASLLKK